MFKFYLPKYSEKYITSKNYKEFNVKIPLEEEVPIEPGIPMSHQIVIANLMKGITNIEGLLIVHDMGTGKSCTAIKSIEENLLDETYGMKQAIILNKGKSIMGNFISELLNKCTTRYTDNSDEKFSSFYTFDTFELFAKNMKNRSDKYISTVYNNTFLVIDEVHNILNTESDVYLQIERFINLINNKKILLLTGTPVRDVSSDIVPIINLLFTKDEKINKETFVKTYYTDDKKLKDTFKQKILGKVSYLKSPISKIPISYVGEKILDLKEYNIIPLFMEDHQEKYYLEAHNKDIESGCIYNNSRQASRFVFPDGSWGSKGFNKYVKFSNKFRFTSEMSNDIRKYGNTKEDILKRIKELSVSYEYKIKKILEADSRYEKSLVYDDLVKGSGLVVFALLLQELKFNKFALFSAETASISFFNKFQKKFNEDILGKNISVILGSKVIMEGFTFTNVLHEHVVPHWNSTETNQVIARGIRLGSHREILKIKPQSSMKIYREVVLTRDRSFKTIDYIMTKLSEEKNIEINEILNAIEEASITCESFYERNNSNKCIIKKSGEEIPYNYIQQDIIIEKIIKQIQKILNEKNYINIIDIANKLNVSKEEIFVHCFYLISRKISWINYSGVRVYLKNNGDTIFMSDSILSETDENISIYSKILKPQDYSNLVNRYENSLSLVLPNRNEDENIQKLLEFSLISKLGLIPHNEVIVNSILDTYEKFCEYDIEKKSASCWYLYSISKGKYDPMCIENPRGNKPWNEWKKCSEKSIQEIEKKIRKEILDFEKEILEKNYKQYGLVNPNTGDFCIKEIIEDTVNSDKKFNDKRYTSSGKRCINLNKFELMKLSNNFNVSSTLKDSRLMICEKIKNKMEDLNLIKEDRFCGIQNKKK